MSTDALSEVLHGVRLQGAIFFTVDCSSPWVAEAPRSSTVVDRVLPGAEHMFEYHVVRRGSCWAGIPGEPAVQVSEGDIIVFAQGDPHVLASSPDLRGRVQMELYEHPKNGQLPISLSINCGGADRANLVCGFIGFDARPFNPLLATLPRLIHVQKKRFADVAWVEHLVTRALSESSAHSAGTESVLARVSELLFIEVLRYHLATMPQETNGWLAGLRDEVTGRALRVLHDRPGDPWTLETLAKEVGHSRSALAERFHRVVGAPPMQYLARWRMQLAASMLSGTTASLAEIADRVGYGSEAALSRAFKRLVGVAPTSWRECAEARVAALPRADHATES